MLGSSARFDHADMDARLPISPFEHDVMTGRNKVNSEPFCQTTGDVVLSKGHVELLTANLIRCACGCVKVFGEKDKTQRPPGQPAEYAVPATVACQHMIIDRVLKTTDARPESLEDFLGVATDPQVQRSVKECLLFVKNGPCERSEADDPILAAESDPSPFDPPLTGIDFAEPVSALEILGVNRPECMLKLFPHAVSLKGQGINGHLIRQSIHELVLMVKTSVGDQHDDVLRSIIKFSVQNSVTAHNFRNEIALVLFHGLPQSKFFPSHILDERKERMASLVSAIPQRFGKMVTDAAMGTFMRLDLLTQNGTIGGKNAYAVDDRLVRKELGRFYNCSERSVQKAKDLLHRYRGDIGPEALRALFDEKCNPGNVAYMICHKILREEALKHREGENNRDDQGYPLPYTFANIAAEFFDANAVREGMSEVQVPAKRVAEGTVVHGNLSAVSLPFRRYGAGGDVKHHRPLVFSSKLTDAQWMILEDREVDAMIAEIDQGRQRWMLKSPWGTVTKWAALPRGEKVHFVSWSLAFLDAYVGFRRPAERVTFDTIGARASVPLCIKTNIGGAVGFNVQNLLRVELVVSKKIHAELHPLGAIARHRGHLRASHLRGSKWEKTDEPAGFVLERIGGDAVQRLDSLRAKQLELRHMTIPPCAFSRWIVENIIDHSNLTTFRYVAVDFVHTSDPSSIASRTAQQMIVIADKLCEKPRLAAPETIALWKASGARGGKHRHMFDISRETRDNKAALAVIRADKRKRIIADTWKNGPKNARENLGLGQDCTETDLVASARNYLGGAAKKPALARLCEELLFVIGNPFDQKVNEFDVGVGTKVLSLMVEKFLPGQDRPRGVVFGMSCGFDLVQDEWDAICMAERNAFMAEMADPLVAQRLARIWQCNTDEDSKKVARTASLCVAVLKNRFGNKRQKHAAFEREWATILPVHEQFLDRVAKKFDAKKLKEIADEQQRLAAEEPMPEAEEEADGEVAQEEAEE